MKNQVLCVVILSKGTYPKAKTKQVAQVAKRSDPAIRPVVYRKIARIAVENYNCLASLAREGVKKNLTPSSAPGLEIDCHG